MSSGRDPVLMIGGSLAALAAGVWLFSLADSGERPERTRRGDKSKTEEVSDRQDRDDSEVDEDRGGDRSDSSSRRERSKKKSSKKSKKTVTSWMPSSAKEVTENAELPKEADERSGCEPARSPIDLARNVALGFERGLRESSAMSVSEEMKIGQKLERDMNKVERWRGKLDRPRDRERYAAWLQAIVDRITPQVNRKKIKYSIHLINDSSFNAFALPGGVMGFHTGLFEGPDAVESEAELAAIVGHEVAHVDLMHPIATYQYAKAILGEGADGVEVIKKILDTGIGSTYELEADEFGNELMARAQYDPSASIRLWKRNAKGGGSGAGGLFDIVVDTVESLVRSHPPANARCHQAELSAADARKKRLHDAYYRGESNIRKGVGSQKRAY
jgi:hypothetical protein